MIKFDEISKLPAADIFDRTASALQNGGTVIVKAPPGSGKSTALIALLLEKDLFCGKKILMLEPRRIACMMVAQRIAWLLGENTGETVGYRMRGEKKISSRTRLEVVTEGTFTRIIQNDMELANYGLIIFDEFHERNIHSDLGLALSLDVKNNLRNDLSLLIMSATLNADELQNFLPQAEFIECHSFLYDTKIYHSPERIPADGIVNAAYCRIINILNTFESGNILVFLTGAYEIQKLCSMLEKLDMENLIIAPLYGALSRDDQQKALQKTDDDERKIVVATNIAESSVTIDDIKFVIDSGLEKHLSFDNNSGMDKLQISRIAKSSAIQRAGRAGRTSDGQVYRLYTIHEFEGMADYPEPDTACIDLSNFCLELAMWGCSADELNFLTPPSKGSLLQSVELLTELDLLDEQGKITALGRKICSFPGSCRVAKMFHAAEEKNLQILGCELAALLEERQLPSTDIRQSLEILRKNPTFSFRKNLDMLLTERRLKYIAEPLNNIGELLLSGFPDRAAKRRSGSLNEYQLANGRIAFLHDPIEGRAGEYIVAPVTDMNNDRVKISSAAVFDVNILPENKISTLSESHFDNNSGVFITESLRCFYKMVIERKKSNVFDESAFKNAVLAECRKRSLAAVFDMDKDDENFLNRCRFAHFSEPDTYPDISEEKLLEDGKFADFIDCTGHSLPALKKTSFKMLLKNLIGYETLFMLDNNYPEFYRPPGGAKIKIRYEAQDAVLSVQISEMYGTAVHPSLGKKHYPLKVELLSPARRPVQVTRDLPSFWHTNWQYVQKEMKQRYIKHFWPDDPANALPGGSIRKKQNNLNK